MKKTVTAVIAYCLFLFTHSAIGQTTPQSITRTPKPAPANTVPVVKKAPVTMHEEQRKLNGQPYVPAQNKIVTPTPPSTVKREVKATQKSNSKK